MENKKEKNYLLIVTLILFIGFIIIYISKKAGYYDYIAHNKAVLTEESINKFEKDVDSGKNVTIDDYLVNENVDYSNIITNIGYNTGNIIETFMNKGIKNTIKIVSALFYN